uniref:Large ribosomal subunit protein bL34c n=1 Tax=Boldia erythrosiphon TaxID=74908 RepID=A0A1Y9TM08_9RHOD|nr:50S ribosomal protein L34 [Boldia erythrosiphon]ARO90657.1 50S ribosomal protein L34 [Boldia erythrosiphon]
MTKQTLQGTRRKRIKTSGFQIRMKTHSGRKVIKGRRRKGRFRLTISSSYKK